MSLDWQVNGVDNYLEVCFERTEAGNLRLKPVADALVWSTLFIGWGEITKENYRDWWTRLHIYELVFGPYLHEHPITLEEVKAHIGLHTNVWPKVSDAMFYKKLRTYIYTVVPKDA